jgi:hypothetical protein
MTFFSTLRLQGSLQRAPNAVAALENIGPNPGEAHALALNITSRNDDMIARKGSGQ